MTPERHRGWLLLAAVPFAATLAFTLVYGVDFPRHDEWNMIPGIGRVFEGKLSWSLLFSNLGGPWRMLLAALAVLSIGSGLTRPPLFGLLSVLTPPDQQGATIGVAQSAGSLARIFGPMFAGGLFEANPAIPYVTCAIIALLTGVVAWSRLAQKSAEGSHVT